MKIISGSAKSYLLKIILFLIIIVVADFLVGSILSWFYYNQKSGNEYDLKYSLEEVSTDGIILGSSRALHHYNCKVFEEKLNIKFYNAGRDGSSILFSCAQFYAIVKRYTPKIMILDINVGDLMYDKQNYDRLSALLPYYKHHPELRGILNLRSPIEKIKVLSKIYVFNSSLGLILAGNLKKQKPISDGFKPLAGSLNNLTIKEFKQVNFIVDTNVIIALKGLAYSCKTKNIQLYVVMSPTYMNKINETEFLKICQIVEPLGGKCLNFTQNKYFLSNPQLFKDNSHLNVDGANVFSEKFAETISVL